MTRLHDQGLYETKCEHDACGIGAVVNITGTRDHSILEYGKQILINLTHRGAAGSDETTGDGAGILFQIPHEFLVAECEKLGFGLPEPPAYGVAMVFGPRDAELRGRCERLLEESLAYYGMAVLGWRDVPVSSDCLGKLARAAEPVIRQVFVGCAPGENAESGASQATVKAPREQGADRPTAEEFERRLFLARKRAERLVSDQFGDKAEDFYIASLSCRTVCYKGMFMAWQLFAYYRDLADERVQSALAIVHQRYSTNTFPNWRLAQPFRCIAHNGEINTLSGNRNHMRAREPKMSNPLYSEDIRDLFPVLVPGGSDSACFDNAMELLVQSGRSLPHAMMMMIPEAFGAKYHISTDKRAFYEYHSSIMEPWDGPAAMVFTDGRLIGGVLDRNGLRPCRYLVTTDGLAIIGSEAGVVEFPPEKIRVKGRLRPGRMFLVDTVEGRIISDNEVKSKIVRQKPYRRWLDENRIELRGLFDAPKLVQSDPLTISRRMRAFGYTREELRMILTPMGINGQEPVGSMGNDTPLAVLSERPKLLFSYFKQLFAQVTNPAIDPLREGLVMSLMSFTGKKGNLLDETPQHCRQLKLPHPILTNEDMERLRSVRRGDFRVATVPSLFEVGALSAGDGLRRGLDTLIAATEQAVREGASLVILSDREVSATHAPIPSLLAVAAVHHAMLKKGLRHEAGLIVESGEPREVMHFCLLCGYGANGINPYMAFESLDQLKQQGELAAEMEPVQIADNYIAAVKKGILKTMSKMGISTLRSYCGAQLFEAIGLDREVVETYFTGTSSRIRGIGLEQIARETLERHRSAFQARPAAAMDLDFGGEYHFRQSGERHLWNPTTVAKLQHAVRSNDPASYAAYAKAINDQAKSLCTLRGLFEFTHGESVPLDEVEPASEIVKRFCTGAMSHGSISKEAHECLAIAMNRLGGMSNTGEGGEDPKRYQPEPNGDSKNCGIKQIASARFGVTIHYLANAKELQIKIAQGAKPGEGGQLPGHKVSAEIAELRHSTPGVTLISPPPHHDIYSIEDLAQLIYDLKASNPGVRVSVKLVAEVGVGTVAAGVAKGNADEVLISGHDGGTGASPLSSIKHAGCPWELGLAETQQVLVMNGLRDRIRVQADGQMRTGRDIVIAALLGAERFGFGTAALVTFGCTLLRKCHEGACAFGIATQDPELRKRFAGKPEHLQRFLYFVAEEARQIMAELGFRTIEEMVGRSDRLRMHKALSHWKAKGLDFSAIFHRPDVTDGQAIRCVVPQADRLADHMDWEILKQAEGAIERTEPMRIQMRIRNVNRTVGAILSNRIVRKYGPKGLPDGTLEVVLEGSAGQSFGAFLAPGVTLRLIGDCNDYLGKGLSGGRIVVQTPPSVPFMAHENIIAGNTLLYGGTRGEVFINGMAGERFAVRNSGVTAVVEGVGDHCCEYMTGGTIVVLGQTGCNFAAGMSGGLAYVLDEMQLFDTLCNLDMVELEPVWQEADKALLYELIERHLEWTGSERAKYVLKAWPDMVGRFVKVIPIDYRKALERMRAVEHRDTETTPATEEVLFHG
ncbi:MAG TPA: glutamate synthase large subunit [Sedimentisphaerales bacterium]|jgi:glutamate synthase domain-containing protein 2/glutamate synthase domain-containing protein 1/glutamate synthase domain-containing protein 3|nr:glutamate synthase large subunit [Sedimentisphaerales bacterium]HNU28618.1 glutamate synthase large subunit [Sedimentisphaerales bacterium]